MAKTLIVKLSDDLDGEEADETVHFALDGKSYEIDLTATNAAKLRDSLKIYIDKGRLVGNARRSRSPRPTSTPDEQTLYSQLTKDEKARFRAWAGMATARRISDTRVKSWVEAGRP